MKRISLFLAVLAIFAMTAIAQDQSSSTSSSGQASTSSSGQQSKAKTSGGEKMAKMTGCISQSAEADGNYTLTNAQHKKGVELVGSDEVKNHAGHKVQVSGHWTSATAGGGQAATSAQGKREFEVSSIKMLSENCTAASATTTPQQNKKNPDAMANPSEANPKK